MPGPYWLPWERIDERSPLALHIAADAARRIIELRYEAGHFLTEADLAAAAGASRTPAREAMLQLETWSLVRLLPKKGAVVTAPTAAERRDMLAFRAMIEINAVQEIAHGEIDLEPLRAGVESALERQRQALREGNLLEFASADYAFHAEIILSGGNSVVSGLLETLGPRVARFTYLAITESPSRLPQLLEEHEALGKSVLRGDAAGYEAQIRQHIAGGHFSMIQAR